MAKYKKLLLTDNVILNGGDSAILKGTIEGIVNNSSISYDDMLIHCDYYDSAVHHYPQLPLGRSLQEAIRKYPPSFFWRFDKKTRFSSMPLFSLSSAEKTALQQYKQADVVVTCGGSFLTDAYDLDLTCFGFDLGLFLSKPMILLGQSLGPFKFDTKKAQVAERLKRFEKIVVRDHLSYQTALEMGCSAAQVIEGRDMAFLIETDAKPRTNAKEKLKIGLSVRKWTYPYAPKEDREALYKDYLQSFANLASSLIETFDAEIVFVSTCQGDKAYSFQDSDVAKQVISLLSEDKQQECYLVDSFQTPELFLEHLLDLDVFVGTRMHACILALISNIPTVNICYEFKSKELFESMGLGEFVVDIEEIEVNNICDRVEIIVERYREISQQIYEKVQEFRTLNQKIIAQIF